MDDRLVPTLAALHARWPWPRHAPELLEDWHGWMRQGTAEALAQRLSDMTCLVVELGTWLGVSARHILTHAPHAMVVCVDHWRGSPEHQAGPDAHRLATLLDQCRRNLWPWRDRLVLCQGDSLAALRALAAALPMFPDLVYVDTEHTYTRLAAELALIEQYWPGTPIVGDDVWVEDVARAAREHADRHGRRLLNLEHCFALE